MEKSINKKNISFSNAPPMIKQKSWDDTDFLKENTWSTHHISKRKEIKKRNEGRSTRKNRHRSNKNYRLSKLREANIALSQNMPNDLLTKEPLKEEKSKLDSIREDQYTKQLLLKHQQIQKLIEEKQKQTQTQETQEMQVNNEGAIPVTKLNNEPTIKEPNLKNKGKWHKIKKTFKNIFKNGGRRTRRKQRKQRRKTRK